MSISQPFTMKPVDLWKAASHLPTSSTGPTTTNCVTYVLISFCYRCPDNVHLKDLPTAFRGCCPEERFERLATAGPPSISEP
jgi:hypothetical protein